MGKKSKKGLGFLYFPPLPKPKDLLDKAFGKIRKNIEHYKSKSNRPSVEDIKTVNKNKVQDIRNNLYDRLNDIHLKIIYVYDLNIFNKFYSELIDLFTSKKELDQNIYQVKSAKGKIDKISKDYIKKILKTRSVPKVKQYVKEFYGRMSSIINKLKIPFQYLENYRLLLRSFPLLKDMQTIALTGFPNVGKSTLLSKITSANPQIDSYAFTTKTLNLGYMSRNIKEIQIIDTPGTLARKDKMNNIELIAELVMEKVADKIVFVIDPTFHYNEEKQLKLLKKIKKLKKPLVVYISKSDIVEKNIIQYVKELLEKEKIKKIFTDKKELKEYLLDRL